LVGDKRETKKGSNVNEKAWFLINLGYLIILFYAVFTYLDVALMEKDCLSFCFSYQNPIQINPINVPTTPFKEVKVDKIHNLIQAIFFGLVVALVFYIARKVDWKNILVKK
jgi:hypothetical protein